MAFNFFLFMFDDIFVQLGTTSSRDGQGTGRDSLDLMGDPIFESAAWFLFIILKFIFTSFFEIRIHEKKIPWHQKKIIFEGRFL